MGTVTKKELIDRIADRTKIRKNDVKTAVQEFMNEVVVVLRDGNRVELRDFGVFEVKSRAPRMAQNPKTLERVPVPAKKTVKFKIGRLMREGLGEPEPRIKVKVAASKSAVKVERKA